MSSAAEQTILDTVAFLEGMQPRLVTEGDFADPDMLDDFGYLPVWQEKRYGGEVECTGIAESRLRSNQTMDTVRYWTAKPTLEQIGETPWVN